MQATKDWRTPALLAACLLPFIGFWATGLTDLDEGYYGAVVAHMLRTGDWVTPHFNGAPWFEKPILAYWLAAPSVALFGETVGPRLPSVLCTLATALVLYRFSKRHFDLQTARVATAAYCGSLLVVGVGRMMLTDAPFVLALTIALTTFYDSVTGNPRLRTWTAVALGFAVLAKGPVAGLFFLVVAALTFWRMPDLRPNFRGHWLPGIALFLAVVAAWYVPAYLANGDLFVQKFLVEQNLGRFQGGDLAHRVPWWSHPFYFPLTAFLALLPFSLWALRTGKVGWPADHLGRYLWIWGLTVVVFFTLSGSKLPHYALPAIAPLTVVTVVAVLKRNQASADFWLKCALGWSLVVFAAATPIFKLDYEKRFAEVHRIAKYLRDQEGDIVLYDVGRQDRQTDIKLTLNPSAHPSFLFYTGGRGKMSDDVRDIVRSDGPLWVVVEAGEMHGELSHLINLGGLTLTRHEPPFVTKNYELWLAEPLTVGSAAESLRTSSPRSP